MQQLGPGSLAFGTMVNAGLFFRNDHGLVIDTMHGPTPAGEILKAAQDRGVKVDYIFNTHSHFDHVFGNSLFGATVISSEPCAATMRSWDPAQLRQSALSNPSGAGDYIPTMPSITFSDRMGLDLAGMPLEFEIYAGHTPGSAIVTNPADGVIFTGDVLFIGRYPYVGNATYSTWCRALRRLIILANRIDARAVVPGHGPILTGGAIESEIGALLSFLETTVGVASRLFDAGLSKQEALEHPAFPWINKDAPESAARRAVCIGRAYDEVEAWGKR